MVYLEQKSTAKVPKLSFVSWYPHTIQFCSNYHPFKDKKANTETLKRIYFAFHIKYIHFRWRSRLTGRQFFTIYEVICCIHSRAGLLMMKKTILFCFFSLLEERNGVRKLKTFCRISCQTAHVQSTKTNEKCISIFQNMSFFGHFRIFFIKQQLKSITILIFFGQYVFAERAY